MTIDDSQFYQLPIRIRNTPISSMPQKYLGASVAAYVLARRGLSDDALEEYVATEVEDLGYEYVKLLGTIRIIKNDEWDSYIDGTWGDLNHGMPQLTDIDFSKGCQVFFGPFACYETEISSG